MIDHAIYGLGYVEHLSYIGIFLTVAFSGYIIPIPEELILIFGGYLAALSLSNIYFVMIAGILGAISGDSLLYYLSGHGNRFTKKYHSWAESTHAGWYIRHMRKNASETIFLSRFLIGFRFISPLVSGLMKVPRRTFISSTSFSAVLYIPCVVLAGFFFHDQINTLVHIALSIRHFIFIFLAISSLFLLVLFFRNLVEKRI